MPASRRFFNEKLPTRSGYLLRLVLTLIFAYAVTQLAPILRPRRFSGVGHEWLFLAILTIAFLLFTVFEEIFVSIQFDYEKKVVGITQKTILSKEKIRVIPFADLSYREMKEGGLRKAPTKVLELFNGSQQVIKLERKSIGEYTFNEIVKEITSLHP
jgi:hypothetical protein